MALFPDFPRQSFKLQVPVATTESFRQVMLYNQDQSIMLMLDKTVPRIDDMIKVVAEDKRWGGKKTFADVACVNGELQVWPTPGMDW